GAVAAAGRLPGQLGHVLLQAARQAFTQGLHVVFAVSAAAVVGAAVLAAVQLRHLRPGAEPAGGASAQEATNRDPRRQVGRRNGGPNLCRPTSTAPPTAPTGASTLVTCTPSPGRRAPPRSS